MTLRMVAVVVVVLFLALVATLGVVWFMIGDRASGDLLIEGSPEDVWDHPRVAPGPPIRGGDPVTLEEAKQRTPYTIPVPPVNVVESDIDEVWVSEEHDSEELDRVYIIYSNGLEISIEGYPTPVDFSQLKEYMSRQVSVRNMPGLGKERFIKKRRDGMTIRRLTSLSWWDNQVRITLYHPTVSLDELIRIGETMPSPTWRAAE